METSEWEYKNETYDTIYGAANPNLPSMATEESGLANHLPKGKKLSLSRDLGVGGG